MKRYVIYGILLFFISISTAWLAGAALPVQGSKHDLSFSTGPGPMKASSSGATQVCVFCHTPHSAKADAPLWNRSLSGASYAGKLYTSDVLGGGGLNYPAAEDPSSQAQPGYSVHVKTRICLSCHDGTIALGRLVNLPYGFTGDIPMQAAGTVDTPGAMPHEAPGYIGLDLRDDHPVAIKYLAGNPDPELKSTSLKLYSPDGGLNNYIECTTCHNPHDNTNGDFLVMSNKNSALCTNCHDKTGYFSSSSIHYTSTTGYDPTGNGSLGTTVGGGGVQDGVMCMGCHVPHKAGMVATSTPLSSLPNPNLSSMPKLGYYLLTYQEEQSCFNDTTRWGQQLVSSCHGNNASAQSKNIETLITGQTSAHDSGNYRGIHSATEAQSSGWLSSTQWHVQCADCHNPHTAGGTSHTSPVAPPGTFNAASSSPLYGVAGVDVPFPGTNWGAPTAVAYTYRKGVGVTDNTSAGVDMEYKICFKCHTVYAWNGTTVPYSTVISGPMTDQAQEFNPNNQSYHPVVAANTPNSQGSTGYTNGWNSGSTQMMYCSDCHTKNGGGTPKGAHGSGNPAILAGPFGDTYGTVGGSHQDTFDGANGLCFQCHLMSVYSTATNHIVVASTDTGFRDANGYNLHNQHRYAATLANKRAYRCVNCHVRVAHGWKRKALIVLQGDGIGITGAPYEAGGQNTGLIVTSTFPAPGTYTQSSCGSSQAANGVTGCHL